LVLAIVIIGAMGLLGGHVMTEFLGFFR